MSVALNKKTKWTLWCLVKFQYIFAINHWSKLPENDLLQMLMCHTNKTFYTTNITGPFSRIKCRCSLGLKVCWQQSTGLLAPLANWLCGEWIRFWPDKTLNWSRFHLVVGAVALQEHGHKLWPDSLAVHGSFLHVLPTHWPSVQFPPQLLFIV